MGFRAPVEVPLFLTFFGFLLTTHLDTNLLIYRTCYVTLGFDKHNCSMLGNTKNNITKELEKLVEPTADIIRLVKILVDSLSAAVTCLIVGAWSDRFGRKPVLVVNIFGYILMYLVMVVFSKLENASPWFMMTSSIPVILTGGGAALLTVLLAYLTDITPKEQRGFRMGIFEVTMAVAVLAGSSSSSYVFNATSYATCYSIAAMTCFLAFLYTWWLLPESLEVRETTGSIKGLFEMQNMSDMFRTSFRNRPHFNRAVILLVMFALALYFVVISGDGSVTFLFVREKFHWTLKLYTLYTSATNVMWISGTLFIVYVVHHKLHVKESILIMAGFISLCIGTLFQGFIEVGWLIYVAAVIKIPSSGISPMTRSLLSKLVDVDEAGKIFAVFNFTHHILGLVGSPVYTTLYNATINTNPGAYNFLTSSVHAVNTICLVLVLVLQKRTSEDTYAILKNDHEEENEETSRGSESEPNIERSTQSN